MPVHGLRSLTAPQARDKLEDVRGKIVELEDGLKSARSEVQSVAKQFDEVRAQDRFPCRAADGAAQLREERLRLFMNCFKHVAEKIEEVYDLLTRSAERRSLLEGWLTRLFVLWSSSLLLSEPPIQACPWLARPF